MSDASMDIILLGEPRPGVERATVVRNLAATFKKEVPVIEKMLRRPRTLLKAGVTAEVAARYKLAIEKAGGQCDLVNHGEPLFPPEAVIPNVPAAAKVDLLKIVDYAAQPAADVQVASTVAEESSQANVMEAHYCQQCGAAVASGMAMCPPCFTAQTELVAKSNVTAGWLAFLLGGFGVHRFYLGQWWGAFYLAFAITSIPALVAIIEGIIFWATPAKRWQRHYGQIPKADNSVTVAAIMGAVAFLVFSGILAAIAVPAYQDHVVRTKVKGAMPLIVDTQQKVAAFIININFYPSENILAGLPEKISNAAVNSIQLLDGAKIEVTFNIPNLPESGKTIIWAPIKKGGTVIWNCQGGSLADRYQVAECRGGNDDKTAKVPQKSKTAKLNRQLFSDDRQLSIRVPDSWAVKHYQGALIGAISTPEAAYVKVQSESKRDLETRGTLDEYTRLMLSLLQKNLAVMQTPGKIYHLNINGLQARQAVVIGTTKDSVDVGYVITLLEGDEHFYQIITWALHPQFNTRYPLLKKISESFSINTSSLPSHR